MADPCSFYINNKLTKGRKYALSDYLSEEITQFHTSLDDYRPTDLYAMDSLSHSLGTGEIFLKDESKRVGIGAFKALGASWAVHRLIKKYPDQEIFCTATDGNHGRALAWACRIMKRRAVIFMPNHTVEARKKNIIREGAELILIAGDYDTTVQEAKKYADRNNCILVQDTSWQGYTEIPRLVSAGYLTMTRELIAHFLMSGNKFPEFMLLQSGVGSWAATMMLSLNLELGESAPRYIIVEPSESDCLLESARKEKRSPTLRSQTTIMAGLNCGTPSMEAWEIIRDLAHAFISIPDSWAVGALRKLSRPEGNDVFIPSCESGAAGLAGLMALYSCENLSEVRRKLDIDQNSRFLLVNSEGITDPESWKEITGLDYSSCDSA